MGAVVTFDEGDYEGIASPLLLRAWLGPVPEVLPEGCSMPGGNRRFQGAGLLIALEGAGLYIEHNEHTYLRRTIPADTIAWLLTGAPAKSPAKPVDLPEGCEMNGITRRYSVHWVMTGELPS
jgi:hypothetical protein